MSEQQLERNRDHWKRLDATIGAHQIDGNWVKRHRGHPKNDRVDNAANEAIDEMLG